MDERRDGRARDREDERRRRSGRTRSIWDRDVTADELSRMSLAERGRQFPDDYTPDGAPLGDF